MTTTIKLALAFALAGAFIMPAISRAADPAPSDQVVPIKWSRFKKNAKPDPDAAQARQILANSDRYNLGWIVKTFQTDPAGDLYIVNHYNENGIRPAASTCYALGVGLTCANLTDAELGIPRAEALKRAAMLVKGVAAGYKANSADGKGWGGDWQSAFWATVLGNGAWMLWDDLDPDAQRMVQTVVADEADRFIAPGYKVPYWTAPDGHVNTPGDTKAEENAWNATLLQLAVAMMPNHPHAAQWKRVGSELMISAFSLKSDLASDKMVDGKPVRDWLNGWNVRDDGAVINHNIVHPDYTVTTTINSRAFLVQSLAGQTISQGAEWNAPFIYQSLVDHSWPSPPYKAPGGPMYIPGKAEVYYPQGTDWSKFRFDIYYLNDVDAHLLGWDKGAKHKAVDWMRIRAKRILAMQARHPDGHMWEDAEYPTYPGREQMLGWQAGDAYLLFWLRDRNAISKSGNWLDDHRQAKSR